MSDAIQKTEENQTPSAQTNICANCGAHVEGKYCHVCGQKQLDGRFTLRSSLSHFLTTVTNIDKGLWHTIIHMFTRPEKVLQDYLSGATVRYFHPFRYLFLWLTIQVFVTVQVIGIADYQIEANGLERETAPTVIVEAMENVNNYVHIFSTLTMPVLAWGLWMLFGRKRYHYGEQLIIACYTYGHSVFISLIFSFSYLAGKDLLPYTASFNFLVSFAYLVYALLRFFKQNVFKVILKTLVAYLIWSIGLFLSMVPYLLLFMAWSYQKDPKAFKEQFGKKNKAKQEQVETVSDSTALPKDTLQLELP